MSIMAKGTKRVQLTSLQVKVVQKALRTLKSFNPQELRQANIVLLKLRK